MHPILAQRGGLRRYLSLWVPVTGIFAGLLITLGRVPILEAWLLATLMCGIYAFVCLATWYPSRALPLSSGRVPRALATHIAAAFLSSAVWGMLGAGFLALLAYFPPFRGAVDRYTAILPLVVTVGMLFYLLATALHYVAIAVQSAQEAERAHLRQAALAREAELRALRAQIDPHFLFNSLNAIGGLALSDGEAARTMCGKLAGFLRRTLALGAQDRIPLAEELALTEDYLAVERVRLGDRLRIERTIDPEAASCLVPPLLLQPLVENAIRHGVATRLDGGVLRLLAKREDGMLYVSVDNPRDPDAPPSRGGGLGLANVRERLRTQFGDLGILETRSAPESFHVALRLPAEGT
jgi:LytS/YehU family sensor histidine kinase